MICLAPWLSFPRLCPETPAQQKGNWKDASLSEFYPRQYLFPFHIRRRRYFEFGWVSSFTQKAANTFPRPLLDSIGDAVLEQGLVAVVLCQLLLQMALFFSCFPLCQASGRCWCVCLCPVFLETTMYLFKTFHYC